MLEPIFRVHEHRYPLCVDYRRARRHYFDASKSGKRMGARDAHAARGQVGHTSQIFFSFMFKDVSMDGYVYVFVLVLFANNELHNICHMFLQTRAGYTQRGHVFDFFCCTVRQRACSLKRIKRRLNASRGV